MKRPARYSAILLVVLATCTDLAAWAPETRMRMVRDALNMMPRSLRTVMRPHEHQLMRGALEPLAAEGSTAHLPPSMNGTLPDEIVRRSTAVVAAVDGRKPFSEVARRFGALSHFIADAGFPPLAGGADGAGHYEHFADLVRSRDEKIRFVFYGHEDEAILDGDLVVFTGRILARAVRQDAELARVYAVAGDPPAPAFFDDRSVPFAVASLAYSKTVTDIVRAWLDAWEKANGDLGRTPYLEPSKRKKKRSS